MFRRPPHGGRGLKYLLYSPILKGGESSPSRGTWIEIAPDGLEIVPVPVVPLTGDVD